MKLNLNPTFQLLAVVKKCFPSQKLCRGNATCLYGLHRLHHSQRQSTREILSSNTKGADFVARLGPFPVSPRVNMQFLKVAQHACHFSTSENKLKESLSPADMKKAMDQLTEQFTEARELIEDARESLDTVYFSEDMAEAQEAVKTTLDQYQKFLNQLSDDQRQEVLRTIGLRMEELKAQEQALNDTLHDSH